DLFLFSSRRRHTSFSRDWSSDVCSSDLSMGPKVEAACRFVEITGGMAAIGRLEDSEAIIAGTAGTIVTPSGRYTYEVDARNPSKIGRASCREREESNAVETILKTHTEQQ